MPTGKVAARTAGIPNLVNPNAREVVRARGAGQFTQAPARRDFWAPVFSAFPFRRVGGFVRSLFGVQAVGPVNSQNSYGGITVTPELAMMLSSVWACVGRYQKTVGTLPLNVMRGGPGNSAQAFREHPLHRILHDQPNTQMSAAAFWMAFVGQAMTWGAGYAQKLKFNGRIVGLKPLLSAYMTTYLDEQERLRFYYAPGGAPNTQRDFAGDEIFVVMDRTLDGYAPLSRIQYAANSMGVAIAGDRAANLAFKNGLRASGILTIGQWLKPDQREAYRRAVNDFLGTGTGDGSDKQGGVMVAENATKYEPLSLKTQDIELLASRRYSVEDICRWYDIPPILISHAAEGQTMWGSGIEQIILGWLKLGLAPVLRTIEQEIWRQLLPEDEKAGGVFAEFNLEGLLRGDSAARASFYSQMAQNGVYTRDEIRARENLPPLAGGDKLTVQSNMTPLDQLGNNPAADAQQLRAALRAFLGKDEGVPHAEAKGP